MFHKVEFPRVVVLVIFLTTVVYLIKDQKDSCSVCSYAMLQTNDTRKKQSHRSKSLDIHKMAADKPEEGLLKLHPKKFCL